MSTMDPRQNAGYRYHRTNPLTGEPVAVYLAAAQRLEWDKESKWIAVCESHGSLVATSTLALAKSASKEPEEWCDECRDASEYRAKHEDGTRALVIGLDGSMRDEYIVGLDDLTRLVGGPIQALSVPAWEAGARVTVGEPVGPHTMYVNEESKIGGEQPRLNVVADALMVCSLMPSDWVAGVAVVVGYNPDTGEDVDHTLDPATVLLDAATSAEAWTNVASDREVLGRARVANVEMRYNDGSDALATIGHVYANALAVSRA